MQSLAASSRGGERSGGLFGEDQFIAVSQAQPIEAAAVLDQDLAGFAEKVVGPQHGNCQLTRRDLVGRRSKLRHANGGLRGNRHAKMIMILNSNASGSLGGYGYIYTATYICVYGGQLATGQLAAGQIGTAPRCIAGDGRWDSRVNSPDLRSFRTAGQLTSGQLAG